MSKNWPTAGDITERRKHDPELQRIRAEVEARHAKHAEEMRQAQEPLLRDLAEAGVRVETISTLVNTREGYSKAIPVLMKHLERTSDYPEVILNSIARALTVREARGVANRLMISLFRADTHEPKPNGFRWCLGNALSVVAEFGDVNDLIDLIQDTRHGVGRDVLPEALVRFVGKRPDIIDVLDTLQDDPDIGDRVRQFLKRKAVQRAREKRDGRAG